MVITMKILLDGYYDGNFGDDLMLTLAACSLSEHEIYVPSDRINIPNARCTRAKTGFDLYLKVTGSGFIIYDRRGMLYRMRGMRAEKRYAKKRVVLSCNISDFISKSAEKLIQRQLHSYGLVTVRDGESYEYIRRNLPSVNCKQYPDIVFSLPDEMIPKVRCEGALGIAVHASADASVLAYAADKYAEETGKNVLLLCFDTGIENDAAAAQKVYEAAKRKNKIEVVLYSDIMSMLAAMKRCSVILGIRLHSIILAARMGIPFVPVAYSRKTANVLSDFGYSGRVYTPGDPDIAEAVLTAEKTDIDASYFDAAFGHMTELKRYIDTLM